jgi:hypothetical protein
MKKEILMSEKSYRMRREKISILPHLRFFTERADKKLFCSLLIVVLLKKGTFLSMLMSFFGTCM